MIHIFKYSLKRFLHNKAELFWLLLFPILLGTMFNLAFGGLENDSFDPIPVAVVCEEGEMVETFRTVAEELGKEGKDQFLDVTYCKEKKANSLLKKKSVDGILYVDDTVSLSISNAMQDSQLNQSMLKCFVDTFCLQQEAIKEIAKEHPEQLMETIQTLTKEISYNQEISLGIGDQNLFTQYFYNAIAMACLFSAMSGIYIALHNEGNLSDLGARKNLSPTNKLKLIVGELLSCGLYRFLSNLVAFAYYVLVLKIDMTARLPYAILAIFSCGFMGNCLGFFIGTIGKMSEKTKDGIATAVVMICCFLSGLMNEDMRLIVEEICPWFNKINPAALCADCFYTLSHYESLSRYTQNIITLWILSIVFCLGGFFMTRRKNYASL